jgi:hypothetical protein
MLCLDSRLVVYEGMVFHLRARLHRVVIMNMRCAYVARFHLDDQWLFQHTIM